MLTRRDFATAAGAALVGCGLGPAKAAVGWPDDLARALARIEAESGGRLGVAVLDSESGARTGHRADERFPLCSTFKALAAAAVLARVDAGQDSLARRVRFEASDLVPYSPATKGRAGGEGMSLAELCDAAVTVSDNTAGNLLLATLGGPSGLTAYLRTLGDATTRLDRVEPDLNEAVPGDPRDTTTPAAMAGTLQTLVFGNALSGPSREQFVAWLVANKTGDARLRAGLPKGWRAGDKTGSGERGTTNDVGVIWPPRGSPVIVAAYLTETAASLEQRNAALAAVGRAVAGAMERG